MAPMVSISLHDGVLTLWLSPDDWLTRGHCATVHLEIECPNAAAYQTGTKYQPIRAWACDATVAPGQSHCPRHWFGHFCLYAQDGQAVAVAASTLQLASVLQLAGVRVCGASSKQPVALPEALGPAIISQQHLPPPPPPAQQPQEQPRPSLQLSVPKPGSATVRAPCCAVMVMVDVGAPQEFVRGPVYKVPYSWCCGREAGSKDFCKLHTTSRFILLDRNLVVMATVNTPHLLAANLGYADVSITSEQQDLLQKLSNLTDATATATAGTGSAAAAAAAGEAGAAADGSPELSSRQQQQQQQRLDVGQKRSSAEAELPLPGNAPKVAANGRPGPAAAAGAGAGAGVAAGRVSEAPPAVLRLQLTADDAAEQRSVLQQREEALQGEAPADLEQQLQELQAALAVLDKMCGPGYDLVLPVSQGSSNNPGTRCLGVTLQLGVAGLRELADASTFVRILDGRCCGHEGGARRACKKHRQSTFCLLSATGEPLVITTHLAGLAQRLKVSSVSLLDAPGQEPIPHYLSLPAAPTWRRAADSSSLRVWVPPDAKGLSGNWQQRPCCGLDIYVDRPKDAQQAVGSPVTIMSIVRCGNEASGKPICKRHTTQGPLPLFSWSDGLACATSLNVNPGGAPIHGCSDLAQLAMWLGVGKVEVLDADSNEPLPFYAGLAIPPAVQLPLTSTQQALLPTASLAPPSLTGALTQQPGGTAAAAGQGPRGSAALAAALAAAGVAAVRLDSNGGAAGAGEDGGGAAAAAAAGGGAGLVEMLAAAAQGGGLRAINLFGNSKVEVAGLPPEGTDQQQEGQQQQQQGQDPGQAAGQLVICVEPRPVGGHQARPCCMLDVVLLLQDKAAYQQGQRYPVLFAQRCGNEAGNRSRCRQHADCALRIVATDPASVATAAAAQGVPTYALHTAKPALTHSTALAVVQEALVVRKVNSSRDAATVLGVGALKLLDGFSGEDLGEVTAWSPTNPSGTAAKVAAPSRDAAATAAGVPGVPNAQALLAALAAGRVPGVNLNHLQGLTKVEQYEVDGPAVTPAAAAAGAAGAGGAGAAAGAAAGLPAQLGVNGGAEVASKGPGDGAGTGSTAVEPAVSAAAAAVEQPQQQLPGSTLPPSGVQQAPPTATAAQAAPAPSVAPAAPPAAAAAGGGAGSGAGRAAFGSSAPRHLAQWAINFKPPADPPAQP